MATKKAKEDSGEKIFKTVKVKFTEKEQNNSSLRKGRVEEYKVKESEKGFIHIEVEKTQFKTDGSMDKVSVPSVIKLNKKEVSAFEKNARGLGYAHTRVLHTPDGIEVNIKEKDTSNPNEKKK